jgi:hypothetical protein
MIPYTSMPQNFPSNRPDAVAVELFPGGPPDHIEAVRNVLMNYNRVFETEMTKTDTAAPVASEGGGLQ